MTDVPANLPSAAAISPVASQPRAALQTAGVVALIAAGIVLSVAGDRTLRAFPPHWPTSLWAAAGVVLATLVLATYDWRLRVLTRERVTADTIQELSAERQRIQTVIDGTHVGTWEVKPRSGEMLIDARFAEILGYALEELSPLTLERFLDMVEPSDLPQVSASVSRCEQSDDPIFLCDFRLRHKAGHWVWIASRGRVVEFDHRRRPLRMVGIHVDISHRKSVEQQLSSAATTDPLTGLANRKHLMSHLALALERQAAEAREGYAVLFLDFDHFKLINDTMGHAAGDDLLQQIARRLQLAVRPENLGITVSREPLVARFGGDEFLILLTGVADLAAIEGFAIRLLASLAHRFVLHGRDIYASASAGIVTSAQEARSAEAVIQHADLAMYDAKRAGRSRALTYRPEMLAKVKRHVEIEEGLRSAIGSSQLSVVYQPIIELQTGRVCSVEALVRWTHPTLGRVSPAEFIPVAEESDLIVSIGAYVLREACEQFAKWHREGAANAPITISVNLSRAELALGEPLIERIRQIIKSANVPAECLQLEITEREIMREPEESRRVMERLKSLGVRLAMDDFGTGTSSLSCLGQYPFDVIKLDRTFLQGISGNPVVIALVHAAVNLIDNLGISCVAEGVERAEDVAILISLGCRHAQGFYFSPPLPPEELSRRDFATRLPAPAAATTLDGAAADALLSAAAGG